MQESLTAVGNATLALVSPSTRPEAMPRRWDDLEERMGLRFMNTRLLVSDFKACFRFYRDVLGFTPTFGSEEDVYADFDTGGAGLALFRRDLMAEAVGTASRPATADGQDRVALVFEVEDVDAACQQLQARGVALVTAPKDRADWGIRTAHFRDPDANLLEIYAALR